MNFFILSLFLVNGPDTISQLFQTSITNCFPKNSQSSDGMEIEELPKKLQKVDKQWRNLRNSSKIFYSSHFLSKAIKRTKSHNNTEKGNKVGGSLNSGILEEWHHLLGK